MPRAAPTYVIALDLGGTKLSAALFDDDGRPCEQQTVAIKGREGPAVGEMITDQVKRLLEAARQQSLLVSSVGACVPGVAHPSSGRVWAPNIPGWDDYPLRDEIVAATGGAVIRVVVDSDRAASILGEAWQGAARGLRDAIFLAVGTGIGAGILVDGRVVHGAHGTAGAVGWWALDPRHRDQYASCGGFEGVASGEGLARAARALVAENSNYDGPLSNCPALSSRDVFDAYATGDAVARMALQQAIEFWAMASANLVSLFNPEAIVFGGGMFGPATGFLQDIAVEARRWAQPLAIDQVRFVASQLGPEAALFGAAYLARHGGHAPVPQPA